LRNLNKRILAKDKLMFFDLLGEDVGRRSLLIIFSLIVIFLGSVWNHVLR